MTLEPPFKLVSLNIERSKHLELVLPFLEREKPDAVCLQELMERDVPRLENICGACFFTPMTRHPAENNPGIMGTGIFSRDRVVAREERYYLGSRGSIVDFDTSDAQRKHATESRAVAFCDIERNGRTFRIATTHFTWTPNGKPDDLQRADMKNLLEVLDTLGEFVLCGDFNAPRGGEIFSMLAAKYKDNVPVEYKTSIDMKLHRAAHLPSEDMDKKMVDGLFTTPEYAAEDVQLRSGVSDHQAITATITRNVKFS